MSACEHVYMSERTSVYIYMYNCIYSNIYTYACMYVHVYVYERLRLSIYRQMYIRGSRPTVTVRGPPRADSGRPLPPDTPEPGERAGKATLLLVLCLVRAQWMHTCCTACAFVRSLRAVVDGKLPVNKPHVIRVLSSKPLRGTC